MSYIHKVRYYECDGMAVCHHSNYVRFMEEARIDLLDRLGYGYERMEADGITSPVISFSCNCIRPTRFQDEIDIEIRVLKTTALKLTFSYTMSVGGHLVCTAESTHCFLQDGKPVPFADKYECLRQIDA